MGRDALPSFDTKGSEDVPRLQRSHWRVQSLIENMLDQGQAESASPEPEPANPISSRPRTRQATSSSWGRGAAQLAIRRVWGQRGFIASVRIDATETCDRELSQEIRPYISGSQCLGSNPQLFPSSSPQKGDASETRMWGRSAAELRVRGAAGVDPPHLTLALRLGGPEGTTWTCCRDHAESPQPDAHIKQVCVKAH